MFRKIFNVSTIDSIFLQMVPGFDYSLLQFAEQWGQVEGERAKTAASATAPGVSAPMCQEWIIHFVCNQLCRH